MRKTFDLSVYFIADPTLCNGRPVTTIVAAALAGGATLIQYRDKTNTPESITNTAREILEICRAHDTPLLINDHVEVAAQIGADGAHIGQGDIDPQEARRILGPDAILGLTAFTPEHFAALDPAIIDYTGTGPVYNTLTDKGKPVIGPDGLARLIALSPVPVVGIGGITPENAQPVIEAGAHGVAMMRAVSGAARPDLAAHEFVKVVQGVRDAA